MMISETKLSTKRITCVQFFFKLKSGTGHLLKLHIRLYKIRVLLTQNETPIFQNIQSIIMRVRGKPGLIFGHREKNSRENNSKLKEKTQNSRK